MPKRPRIAIACALASSLPSACFLDWTIPSRQDAGDATVDGSRRDSARETGPDGLEDAFTGELDAESDGFAVTDSNSGDAGSTDGNTGPKDSGLSDGSCLSNADCPTPADYCDFSDNRCGKTPGKCRNRKDCDAAAPSTRCSCEAKIVTDLCALQEQGIDWGEAELCSGRGYMACVDVLCKPSSAYCSISRGTGSCAPLPIGCTSCSCVPAPCSNACSGDPDAGFVVRCP